MATIYTQRSYTESDRSKKAREELEKHQLAKPDAYESQWLPALDTWYTDANAYVSRCTGNRNQI